MNKKTRVTITGGAGLIGSELVKLLVPMVSKVRVIDDFSKGKRENLKDVSNKIELIEGDLECPVFCKSAIEKCDYFFHLASRAYGIGYGDGRHLEVLEHNERITTNILSELSRKRPGKLLVASSSCIYSDSGPDLIPELNIFDQNPERANLGYGWAKRFLEQKCEIYSQETSVPLVIFRPFNIYGENYCWAGEYSQAIPMLVKKIFEATEAVEVWGSGNQRRSYIHAKDCARMMLELSSLKNFQGTINLGTTETISMKDLVSLIAKVNGLNREFYFNIDRPEGRKIKSSDTSFFEKVLPNFKYEISLDEGLKKMALWYVKNFR